MASAKKKGPSAASTASPKTTASATSSACDAKTQAARDVKAAARQYLERGWNVMRLPPNDKEVYKDRPHAACIITLKNIDTLKEDENVAVYFSKAGALKDIDFDYKAASALAREINLQDLTASFGRPSVGIGHCLFNAPGCKAMKFTLPDVENYPRDLPIHNGRASLTVLEIRGNNNTYTMVPPSVHPSGETLVWIKNDEPREITPVDLRQWAGRHALAATVLYFYPEHASARYEVRMALTGALARSGMEPEQVTLYVQAVARLAGDPKWDEDFAERTAERLQDKEQVTGIPRLVQELQLPLPEQCERTFRKWLMTAKDAGTEAAKTMEQGTAGVSLADFYSYMPQHSYMYAPSREMWPASSVDARIGPIEIGVNADGEPITIPAHVWLDCNRPVEMMTWAPEIADGHSRFPDRGRRFNSTQGCRVLQFVSSATDQAWRRKPSPAVD